MKNQIQRILTVFAAIAALSGTGLLPKPLPTPPDDFSITQPDQKSGNEDEPQFDIPIDESDQILQ